MITITNEDNMELMARYPDNYFDLAIVDPPYGLDMANKMSENNGKQTGVAKAKRSNYKSSQWDLKSPEINYFNELIRVSKNQIIWGANHFISKIPIDSSCWVVWDKNTNGHFADCELAWTSFDTAVRKFEFTWNGMLQGDMKNKEMRIHPTQKPVKLYEWLLMNYAKEGEKILDTHLGSGSIAIACHNLKFDLTACELDKDYYEASLKRLHNHQSQLTMF
jgi:site-specific DNA-methyltransferase (adenine-specific)